MKFAWIVLLGLWISSPASAGVSNGGGGKGVVCRNEDQSIKSIELLDLYEGRILYGLQTKSFGPDIQSNLLAVSAKLTRNWDRWFPFTLKDSSISHAQENMKLLPVGTKLLPIDDAAAIAIPQDCALEQVAYYQDDNTLLVDQALWNALDVVNRAALFVHEGLYSSERILGATDSRRARRVVAHLFSDFQFVPVMEEIPKNALKCYAILTSKDEMRTAEFYEFPSPKDPRRTIFQFLYVHDGLAYSRIVGEIGERPKKDFVIPFGLTSDFESPIPMALVSSIDSKTHRRIEYFSTLKGREKIECSPQHN